MVKITPIPAFENNYFWVIQPDPSLTGVIVVDPGSAQPVLDHLQQHQLTLDAILLTHRHRDHIGGVDELRASKPIAVYGPRSTAMPQVTHYLTDRDLLDLSGLTIQVIAVPGHTREHIAYYLPAQGMVFCGDALFAGGCGRRFDGTAEIMWESLQKLAALPDDTFIYCAHEYTLSNLRFALAVEPSNIAIQERLQHVEQLRTHGQVTLPSTILLEKRTNPFLRCKEGAIKHFVQSHHPAPLPSTSDVFGALRTIKDTWPT